MNYIDYVEIDPPLNSCNLNISVASGILESRWNAIVARQLRMYAIWEEPEERKLDVLWTCIQEI